MIKIKYSKERLKINLIWGLTFISGGVVLILLYYFIGKLNYILESVGIGLAGAGFMYLMIYFYEYKKQYLSIKNGELIKYSLLPKKIKLSQVKSIKEFAGYYKLKMDKGEFVIDTKIIDSNSFSVLKSLLKELKIPWI